MEQPKVFLILTTWETRKIPTIKSVDELTSSILQEEIISAMSVILEIIKKNCNSFTIKQSITKERILMILNETIGLSIVTLKLLLFFQNFLV